MKTMLLRQLRQFAIILLSVMVGGFAFLYAFLLFPTIRDMLVHNAKLKSLDQAFSAMGHPANTAPISRREQMVGILSGNSNHCDYFIGQIMQYSGDAQEISDFYHQSQINIIFIENGKMPEEVTWSFLPYQLQTLAGWGITQPGVMERMYIAFLFDGFDDPGMDFRCD